MYKCHTRAEPNRSAGDFGPIRGGAAMCVRAKLTRLTGSRAWIPVSGLPRERRFAHLSVERRGGNARFWRFQRAGGGIVANRAGV